MRSTYEGTAYDTPARRILFIFFGPQSASALRKEPTAHHLCILFFGTVVPKPAHLCRKHGNAGWISNLTASRP